uniref:Uncharacterized protein n=1 Tax=Arundo donax TaxID=35708 RepID=A0A0A9HUM0_ARUDO
MQIDHHPGKTASITNVDACIELQEEIIAFTDEIN